MNPTSLGRRGAARFRSVLQPTIAATKYPHGEEAGAKKHYGSSTFRDDYAWLENTSDPAVKEWVAKENALTRSILDAVPARDSIAAGLTGFSKRRASRSYVQSRGGRLFAMKSAPPKEQSTLIVLDDPNDAKSERVVFDPNKVDPSGETSIDFYVPSLDGKRVADLALQERQRGRHGARLRRRHAAASSATSSRTSTIRPRRRRGVERRRLRLLVHALSEAGRAARGRCDFYQQVWFHKLGTPASADTYAVGKEFPRIAETTLETSDDGSYVLATVLNGDGGEVAHWLRRPDGTWIQITRFADKIRDVAFGGDGALYLLSHKGAPHGKMLRVAPDDPKLTRETVIAEGKESIDAFAVGRNAIYVADDGGGPSELETFDRSGKPLGRRRFRRSPRSTSCVRIGADDVLFRDGSYIAPPRWFRYDERRRRRSLTPRCRRFRVLTSTTSRSCARWPPRRTAPRFRSASFSKRARSSTDQSDDPLRLRRLSASATPGFSLPRRVWLERAASSRSPTCAAAASSARRGTRRASSRRSRTSSTTSRACAQHLIERGYTQLREAGHRGRQQRRPADGRRADAASRSCSARSCRTSASTTCCGWRAHAQRRVQRRPSSAR